MHDPALIEHAKAGELRPVQPGDKIIVRGLGKVEVKALWPDRDMVEVQTKDGFAFLVFGDHILIPRRVS
jgi:hypothetical protein